MFFSASTAGDGGGEEILELEKAAWGHHVLVRRGKWKLVNPGFDWTEENFVLYNLNTDPTESTDVKVENPKIFQELLAEWHFFKKKYKVIRLDD